MKHKEEKHNKMACVCAENLAAEKILGITITCFVFIFKIFSTFQFAKIRRGSQIIMMKTNKNIYKCNYGDDSIWKQSGISELAY